MTGARNRAESLHALGVVITGGGSGLGLAMALEFVRRGHSVLVCGRDERKLARAKAACEALHIVQADVSDASSREHLLTTAVSLLGRIDVLVNNAAVCRVYSFGAGSPSTEPDVATNLTGPIELTRRVLEVNPGGCTIANISTGGALIPLAAVPLYSATKAGLHAFTEALRLQLRGRNVRIVEVFPPLMNTGLIDGLEVTGAANRGAEVVTTFARRATDGILRGDRRIADPSFVAVTALVRLSPSLASRMANRATRMRE